MPWLRLDDKFTEHPKLLGLPRRDRWTWLEILTYCARQSNGGIVPAGIVDVLRYVTPAFLDKCVELRLIDQDEDGTMRVHDWETYNAPTVGDRVAAYLQTHPDASANDVHRAIGGKRELVLSEVKRFQSGSSPVPGQYQNPVPTPVPGNRESGTPGGSQSGSPARGPNPNQEKTFSSPKQEVRSAPAGLEDQPTDTKTLEEQATAIAQRLNGEPLPRGSLERVQAAIPDIDPNIVAPLLERLTVNAIETCLDDTISKAAAGELHKSPAAYLVGALQKRARP